MKKISLGSFPLVDVTGKDRKIFESYLIKVVSDLVTANQLSNSIYTNRVNYVTPLSILKFIKEDQKGLIKSTPEPGTDTQTDERSRKAKSIRNAFKHTKQLYQAIASDPFYKQHVFYPIYIEEQIKSNYGYSDFNYDFLILSNDLIKQQLIDEIIFDDKITMLFLVLKCLLTPNIKITDIGITNTGQNFRKYFSLFLETCKNENINPFDMFIRLIKAAGKQKRNNVPHALARMGNTLMGKMGTKEASLYHSKSFVNLFNTEGEIKSADFLLDTSLKQVNEFLEDTTKIDPNYNPILRQYSQAKTHEYGKILSIIDALRAFNKSNNVISEMNSNSMLSSVKVDDQTTLIINKDVIISELETIYFRRFLEDLKFLEKQAVSNVKNEIKKKFGIDIASSKIETEEKVQTTVAKLKDALNKANLEVSSAINNAKAFASYLGFGNFEDIDEFEQMRNQKEYNNYSQELQKAKQLQLQLATDLAMESAKLGKLPRESTIKDAIDSKELAFTVNLEIFQAQLTAAYSEIYQYIYSSSFDSDIISLSGKSINNQTATDTYKNSQSADLKSLMTTLKEISDAFSDELSLNLSSSVKAEFGNLNFNYKGFIQNVIDNDSITNIIIKNVFVPIYTKYSNKAISESNRLKDLKTNNNPLMKKILSRDSLFKAYILTSETLEQSYELLHYIDTIKYEEGIINHPVSKVGNIINKIDFMLKRLGLTDNPVFIYHKDIHNTDIVMLSMPAHLSMTGTNFISQVSLQEFTQFGNINWSQDLWSQQLMFGGPENDKKYSDLKDSIKKIKDTIEQASKDVKNAKDKEKVRLQAKIKQNQDDLRKKEAKLEELQKLQNSNNFTSNVQTSKRFESPNNYQMRYPRPGGNYNTGMDHRGYYPQEQNAIENGYNNSNHLQQQTYQRPNYQSYSNYNQPQINPQTDRFNRPDHYTQVDEQPEQNEFMNNPYIQNRFNQLNN